jgi:hypothetical protein
MNPFEWMLLLAATAASVAGMRTLISALKLRREL